jgi:multidrug resistance efflux pump
MTISGPDIMKNIISKLPTLLLVLVAVVLAYVVYQRWTDDPWTRDGQVRADIVKIAPRVSGYIVEVAVKDNQFVRKGELLFSIDPSSFQLSVDTAQVQLQQARENVGALEAGVKAAAAGVLQSEAGMVAARAMIKQQQAALANARAESGRATRLANEKAGSVENAQKKAAMLLEHQAAVDSARASLSQAKAELTSSQADLDQAQANLGESGDANVRIREAMVQLEEAQLKLSWTSMYAPFDGYITNLDVNEGAFGFPGIPIAAFVDSSSFRVDGYFQETKLRHIHPGDRAIIVLMSHPDTELKGVVDSFGYAINPPDIADTEGTSYLVPQVEPTFDWVRLPQRVPVRIRLEEVPEDIQLISGMTASVAIQPAQ